MNWKENFERKIKNMNTVIVSGGEIHLDLLKNVYETKTTNFIIAVDKGLEALHTLHIMPNHIVGDFDSIDKTILEYYQKESKDYTT